MYYLELWSRFYKMFDQQQQTQKTQKSYLVKTQTHLWTVVLANSLLRNLQIIIFLS